MAAIHFLCLFALLHCIQCRPHWPAKDDASDTKSYRFSIIADMDRASNVDGKTWRSWLKNGTLTVESESKVSVQWDDEMTELTTHDSEKLRGAELSELIVYNGKLLTVGDKIGIVFEILDGKLVPWVILADGDGTVDNGFKGEWMTIKKEHLYVGSHGYPFMNSDGEIVNTNRQFVKKISPNGAVKNIDWSSEYNKMMAEVGIVPPNGYITHEAACYSHQWGMWLFIPRKLSRIPFEESHDEQSGTNVVFLADKKFETIYNDTIGDLEPKRGFSTFKFIPNSADTAILALKTTEVGDEIATYIVAHDLYGNVLMEETKISDSIKFEGLEFI